MTSKAQFFRVILSCFAAGIFHQAGAASLADENNGFAFKLYHQLGEAGGNQFFSPYSISECMGMVYAGARGGTASEIARTFGWSETPDDLPAKFFTLQSLALPNAAGSNLMFSIANGLWAQKGHPFLKTYLTVAGTNFGARIRQADFISNSEPARGEINGWVEEETHGKIKDLLPPGVPGRDTRLVLVNAIYFKGSWQTPFEKSATQDAPFFVSSNKTSKTPLMHREGQFEYAQLDNFQLLEMPYRTGERQAEIVMDILLPAKDGDFKKWEMTDGASQMNEWAGRLSNMKVNVFAPRFKMTKDYSLGEALGKMGMKEAFAKGADFSGMDGAKDLFISAVVHKAFIEVNEEGTEAAAATGIAMTQLAVRMNPPPMPVFRADHPFVFVIREKRSGSILFMGRVVNPTA